MPRIDFYYKGYRILVFWRAVRYDVLKGVTGRAYYARGLRAHCVAWSKEGHPLRTHGLRTPEAAIELAMITVDAYQDEA